MALLALTACGTQPPAPVEFGHSLDVPRAVEPGTSPAARNIAVAPGTTPETVTVQPGDTVYALSRRYHRPVRAIIDDNNLQPPYQLQPGQRIAMPGGQFHKVQPGDTLYSISRAYGVDMYSIAQTNDLSPPYTITVGQQLRISAPGGSAIASAPHDSVPAAPHGGSNLGSTGGVQVESLPPPSAGTAAAPPKSEPAPAKPAAPSVVMPPPPSGTATTSAPEPARENGPAESSAATAPPAPVPEEKPTAPEEKQASTAVPPRSGRTFSWPVRGRIISSFGPKADGLHNDGINIAARAGSPVTAAENGIVVYAGNELRGFGNLLLVRHAGGWITAYAHLDRILVKKGQQVSRGQAIGTVGSSGGVSSPQLHFEIRQGTQAVDPAKFLAVT